MVELRLRALHSDASELGMEPTERFPNVFGVVMDTTYPNGVATVVVFADGTASLYTSTGFGIIGGGGHSQVVRAGRALLRSAEDQRSAFLPDTSDESPPEGAVTIRLLTIDGRLAVTDEELVLGEGRSPVSPVFHAAHAVITELRQIDEAARS
jgi:hypothetical protein